MKGRPHVMSERIKRLCRGFLSLVLCLCVVVGVAWLTRDISKVHPIRIGSVMVMLGLAIGSILSRSKRWRGW